jgi:hypothetical protein
MINTPAIKVFVHNQYLIPKGIGFTEGYLVAADCRPNSFIRWTVYLETGALWSGLPCEAIFYEKGKKLFENHILQPFSCLEGPVSICEFNLLKQAEGEVIALNKILFKYLFTINYEGNGLADDPEQYKTHNIVALSTGQIAAMPNNLLSFKDNWLFDPKKEHEKQQYKRTNKRYEAGG